MRTFAIHGEHPALPGHFPGRPLVPGVVILDHVLDAIEHDAIESARGPLGPLRLPQVKFLQPLLPEQVAHIELRACPGQSRGDAALRWRFRVLRGDEVIASGDVVADG